MDVIKWLIYFSTSESQYVNNCFIGAFLLILQLIMEQNRENKIVFYDGDCGFCNYIVGFILENEKNEMLCFAPLQSGFAQTLLAEKEIKINYSTFYYLKDNRIYSKSKGFFELLKELRFPYRVLRIFRFLPLFLTDAVYDFVAKRRRRLQNPKCYFPTPSQRKRFLS